MDLTTVIFSAFALGWLVLPIMVSGLDGTLDPATLALYPLRTRPLAVGLLAASATGAWPAANLIALLGVMVGLARGGLGLLVAVVAVVLQVLFCITLARLVTTSMAGMLRSRRGKDLAVFLFIPAFALIELLGQVIPRAAAQGGITAASFAGVDAWMRWLPPGLAAHAIQDASDGRPGTALARLGVLAAVIVVLGWLWIRSLSRGLVTADASTQSSQVRAAVLPLARYGLRGAVAARFWIYQRREPTSLVYWAHDRGHHGRRIRQHHPGDSRPAQASGRGDRQRRRRRRVRRVLPRQLGRPDRPAVHHRSTRTDQPPLPAGLLLRPEHRAQRDRGTAAHRDVLRPGGRGQASDGGQCRPPRSPWPASARPLA